MAEFLIITSPEECFVDIQVDENAEFKDWMMACEFLLKKTAQLSEAGYEKALELLCQGSMQYKIMVKE